MSRISSLAAKVSAKSKDRGDMGTELSLLTRRVISKANVVVVDPDNQVGAVTTLALTFADTANGNTYLVTMKNGAFNIVQQ